MSERPRTARASSLPSRRPRHTSPLSVAPTFHMTTLLQTARRPLHLMTKLDGRAQAEASATGMYTRMLALVLPYRALSSPLACARSRYATPSWQADAVKKYIGKKGWLPPAELWNASGRGYPDVSAQARKYVVVANGFGISGISGTSAAAPVFAGLVSLLVSQRLRAGKPPLGFLNPLLYSHPEVFMDIEKGFNPGCGGLGFQATTGAVGWDPLTGLGTPNFQAMSKVVGQLP